MTWLWVILVNSLNCGSHSLACTNLILIQTVTVTRTRNWTRTKTRFRTRTSLQLEFELESRELGWSVEGEPMVILPVSLFSRLFYSTLGSNTSLGAEILDSWNVTGIDTRFVKPLILASYSSYQLFLKNLLQWSK